MESADQPGGQPGAETVVDPVTGEPVGQSNPGHYWQPPNPVAPPQPGQWQAPSVGPQAGAAPQYSQPYAGQPQYAQAFPPPGYQQQFSGYPAYPPPGATFYSAQPSGPTNGLAVGALSTSLSALSLLVLTSGFLAPICLIAAVVAMVLGIKGKRAVDQGRAVKQRSLAIAGFWVGVTTLALSLLAMLIWGLILFGGLFDSFDTSGGGELSQLLLSVFGA